jgi:MORN repeat
MWKENKQHGNGTFTDVDGSKKKGEWDNGVRTKWLE